jgi:prophage regulatory protein
METTITLLRLPQVEARTGLKRSKIYQMIGAKQFPSPLRLGKRSVRWRDDEIGAWISSLSSGNSKEAAA